ncbi:MAG TPA: branched-chain amino acid ABC transporter permease [Hyphomicrobiaceae bacterium]|jgi:branched-chain amino acid transport system permease protein|nr:branched-chain amino acid ABC transporter permease [Hyphomicrobiaceae bacterium]
MGHSEPNRFFGLGELVAILAVALFFFVPLLSTDPFLTSVANQILIAITAAFGVYIMLRMDLMTFAVPAFMAVGGYAFAIASLRLGWTDSFLLTAVSFLVPALVAMPIGALVLRLRGVYFVLVTFALTQIVDLLLFEMRTVTGGSDGLVGMPATTLLAMQLADNRAVLFLACGVTLLAALITAALTRFYRQQFAAIEENDVLAQSLGLVVWRYKAIGFVVAAGLSGMAGFLLVNMLLTAHPTSFSPISSVNYIAYTIIGGKSAMLGPIVGSTLLVWASNVFSLRGEYSQGLFGLLIMLVVVVAKGGIVGTLELVIRRLASGMFKTQDPVAQAGIKAEQPHGH